MAITFIFVIKKISFPLKKIYLIFLLLIFSGTSIFSQISKTHYIPPIAYSGSGSSVPQEQYIYLSTPSINPVNYTIQEIGGSVVSQDIIDNSNPYRYDVPGTGQTQLAVNKSNVGRVITNRGYIITADCPIYVSVRYYASTYQAGAFTSKELLVWEHTSELLCIPMEMQQVQSERMIF
jgi:hypothetical protein